MKKNSFFLKHDQIDLFSLLEVFLKNKILFIFIPTFFIIIGYLIAIIVPKNLTTSIKIDKLTNSQMRLVTLNGKNILNYDFFNEFTYQINFQNNLIQFIENQNRNKSLLYKNNFRIAVEASNYHLVVSIDYKEGIEGKKILQNYLEYTLDAVSQDYFEIIKSQHRTIIQEYERSLSIAKSINLDVGFGFGADDGSGKYSRGFKVLELELEDLKNDLKIIEKLKSFKDLTPNWKFVLLKDNYQTVQYPKKFYFMLVSFFIGLCLSFIIILFNSNLYHKKIKR
jgi:hypothetical protein